eukprot:363841-Chlamydomonas_euryale.AAC.14
MRTAAAVVAIATSDVGRQQLVYGAADGAFVDSCKLCRISWHTYGLLSNIARLTFAGSDVQIGKQVILSLTTGVRLQPTCDMREHCDCCPMWPHRHA